MNSERQTKTNEPKRTHGTVPNDCETSFGGLPKRDESVKLTGHRCQCAACGKYFSRVSVFDKHRTGNFGRDRRCMTTEQMQARGMRELTLGVWVGKGKVLT